jgi:hypothetical protein
MLVAGSQFHRGEAGALENTNQTLKIEILQDIVSNRSKLHAVIYFTSIDSRVSRAEPMNGSV